MVANKYAKYLGQPAPEQQEPAPTSQNKYRKYLQPVPAQEPAAPTTPAVPRSEIDAGIEEAAAAIPGGYQNWQKQGPDAQRMAGLGYVPDPLAQSGFAKARAPEAPVNDTTDYNNPFRGVADYAVNAVRGLEAPIAGLTGGGLTGWAKTTQEDPLLGAAQAVEFISPVDDAARTYQGVKQAGAGLIEGDLGKAGEGLKQAAIEGSYTAMQAMPGSMTLRGLTGPARAAPTTLAGAERAAVQASRAPAITKPVAEPTRPAVTPEQTKPFTAPPEPSGPGVLSRNADRIVGGAVGATLGGMGDALASSGDGGGGPDVINPTTGAIAGMLAPRLARRAYRSGRSALSGPTGRAAFDERVAARAVRKALVSGGLKTEQDALIAARARFGEKPAAVADLTQEGVGTAASLTRLPGATGDVARNRGEDLLQSRSGRLFTDVEDTTKISPATVTADIDAAIREASDEIGPEYRKLYRTHQKLDSDRLAELKADPYVAKYLRAAEKQAKSRAVTAGLPYSDAHVWDLVKRGMDRSISKGFAGGGKPSEAMLDARDAVRTELDNLMGEYQGLRDSADAPRMKSARQQGAKVMGGGLSVEKVQSLAKSLTGRPLSALQMGAVEKLVLDIEKGRGIEGLASERTRRILSSVFDDNTASELVARVRADLEIVKNATRMNPNVGSVTSQAQMGGGEGLLPAAADLFRTVRSPVETALAAMSKSGSYTKAQRDLMGQMLLDGVTPENLARIYAGKKPRGGSTPTPAPAPAAPNTGLGASTAAPRNLPGQTSNASPTVTGALIGGGLGYVASDGDPTATVLGATGLGAASGLVAKAMKGGKPKPAARAGRKPAERPVPAPMAYDGPIEAYHSTPHEFDTFDMAKIGTGEGNQTYGYGLYFAENPSVAKAYDRSLGGKTMKVQLNAKPDELIDFDRPLAEQPKLKAALEEMAPNDAIRAQMRAMPNWQDQLQRVRTANRWTEKEMAENLRQRGFKGVAYLDAGSRQAGKGTRNFVIFDADAIKRTADTPKPPAPVNTNGVGGSKLPMDEGAKGKPAPRPPMKAEEQALRAALRKARANERKVRSDTVMRDNRDELRRPAEEAVMRAERDLLEYQDRQFQQAANTARWKDRGTAAVQGAKKAATTTGKVIAREAKKNNWEIPAGIGAFGGLGLAGGALLAAASGGSKDTDEEPKQIAPSDPRYFFEVEVLKDNTKLTAVQIALERAGFLPSDDADGVWGKRSRDALKAWQEANDMDPSKPPTKADMIELLADAWSGYKDANGKWHYLDGEPIVFPPRPSEDFIPAREPAGRTPRSTGLQSQR